MPGPASSPAPTANLLPSSATRARWAAGLLLLTSALFSLAAALALASWATAQPLELDLAAGEPVSLLQGAFAGFACLLLPVGPACATAFLLWLYQAKRRQRWFGGQDSPRRAVVVWFIPVISVLLPYREMRGLFTGAAPHPDDRRPLLGLWWACFLGAGAFSLAEAVTRGALSGPSAHPGLSRPAAALSHALLAVAGTLAARFVGEFERRTARREAALGGSNR